MYEASGRYYDNQQYDSAVILGERALPLLRQKGMKDEEADELSILSVCCMRQSDYDKALRYAKACYQLDHASGDAERISSSLNTIGSIYVVEQLMPTNIVVSSSTGSKKTLPNTRRRLNKLSPLHDEKLPPTLTGWWQYFFNHLIHFIYNPPTLTGQRNYSHY